MEWLLIDQLPPIVATLPQYKRYKNKMTQSVITSLPAHRSALLTLKIVSENDADQTPFNVRKSTPLKRLMMAYCQLKALQLDQIAFEYCGERLSPIQTPEQLNMSENCVHVVRMLEIKP
eukprot:GEZU01004785.1.p2 GENE.GEZU01004785.1~~GEZU01004785.1.p2  ORF type:complete len:119 (+),score=23.62 GEZU01004785.1:71-427(+)